MDSLGAEKGSSRVSRGGCWNGDAAGCRLALRRMFVPTGRGQPRLPPGPESAWSHSGGGISQGSAAVGHRRGGSVSGVATGDAAAGWWSGFAASTVARVRKSSDFRQTSCALVSVPLHTG